MFDIFNREPVLDDDSAQWLFEVYAWALKNFDADVVFNETILVLPSNEYFPGHTNSVDGMANLIFDKVRDYASMSHWPCKLVPSQACSTTAQPRIVLEGPLRQPGGVVPSIVDEAHRLTIPYDPNLINNPEGMIADLSHTLAHYLATLGSEPPPGGDKNWPYATEVLAVFMGFGLMHCNTALTHQVRSCASCGPRTNRGSYLSQYDLTYALALFCVLKEIPSKPTSKHLKSSLRGYFKRAMKDIRNNPLTARLATRQG